MKYLVLICLLPFTAQSKTLFGIILNCPAEKQKSNPTKCTPIIKYVAGEDIEKAIKVAKKSEKEETVVGKVESLGELLE